MAKKSRIVILGTGGTIAGTGSSPVDEAYEPGKIETTDLIDAVEGIDRLAKIEAESLFSLGSEDLGPEQWWVLARRVQTLSRNKNIDGIVITHGTDTLEEAAFFLDLVTRPKTPVVFTAAMRPATALSADGPANINHAVLATVKLAEKNRRGIYVAMNGLLLPGWQTIKTSSLALNAFRAYPGGPAARVTRNRLMPLESEQSSPLAGKFHALLKSAKPLPAIPCIGLTGGCGVAPLAIWRKNPPAGVVIAGFGAGTMPNALYDLAYSMAQEKTLVVVSSRVMEVCVLPESARLRRASGMIASGFLNPQKSALLLGLALLADMDPIKISALFKRFY